jgi:twitching motility protein PilU
MDLKRLLRVMLKNDASDLYLTIGRPPVFRIEGIPKIYGKESLSPKLTEKLAESLMTQKQREEFFNTHEMNLAIHFPELGRFRVNIFRQKGNIGLVIRQIKTQIPKINELGLPDILKDISMARSGLVLIVGGAGTGKSTTLSAMIDHRNTNLPGHIITVEDPIEFIHEHKRSIITQREIGFDTLSYSDALKNALRQAPDVIMIGEIRDREVMESALNFAETGHLCLSTLHANNTVQAIERVMSFFPIEVHSQIYYQLSINLKAIISQRLIPSIDGRRVVAVEILLDTARVKDLIHKQEITLLRDAMAEGIREGMQTFDQSIYELYKKGKISLENALAFADSPGDLRLKIKVKDATIDNEMIKELNEIKLKPDTPKSY